MDADVEASVEPDACVDSCEGTLMGPVARSGLALSPLFSLGTAIVVPVVASVGRESIGRVANEGRDELNLRRAA